MAVYKNQESFAWVAPIIAEGLGNHPRMAGYYNDNYRVEHDGSCVLLRIPIPNSEVMDVRRIAEVPVLRYLERMQFPAPRLLFRAPSDEFFIHGWIDGHILNDLCPDETRVPDWIPQEIAQQMAALHQLDPAPFADLCADLARSPNTKAFFLAHHAFDCSVHERLLPEMGGIYHRLGVPETPFAGLDALSSRIEKRAFCFCHSDIHRKNIILHPGESGLTLLDWELVLVGDPIYDIAVHFHKMRYAADQEDSFIETYVSARTLDLEVVAVRKEVDAYLQLERIKSAVIDAYRVRSDLLSGKYDLETAHHEVARYRRKLNKARKIWALEPIALAEPREALRSILMTTAPAER